MRTRHHWRLSRYGNGDQLMTYLVHLPNGHSEGGGPGYYLIVSMLDYQKAVKWRICSGPIPALHAPRIARAAQDDHEKIRAQVFYTAQQLQRGAHRPGPQDTLH